MEIHFLKPVLLTKYGKKLPFRLLSALDMFFIYLIIQTRRKP
jgi:hypothetical protein